MTNLTNKVLAILNDIAGIQTVMFDNSHSTNVRIDRKPTPAALLYTLPEWFLDIGHGSSKERAEIQVFFFDRVNFDSKAEDKLNTFENMGEIAREFIYRLLNDNTVRVLDDTVKITATYGEFDSFVCGCTVNLTIEEKQGECLYTEPTTEPNEDNEENQG
jgi:hypothetical protein